MKIKDNRPSLDLRLEKMNLHSAALGGELIARTRRGLLSILRDKCRPGTAGAPVTILFTRLKQSLWPL
jgi:hypothetical protein